MITVIAIGIATVCYLVGAIGNILQKDYPHTLMWFSYATANLGLLWYEYNKATGKKKIRLE